ncbi:NAD(P)(+) transhydrogenase (Re/Si-specific) subunit beta [Microvirga sp. BSC39]|nr:NAD(P)(+) transhydrogenase (Re/Si-specific) subunit beta [Microvirga sp. BSC39]
MEPSWRFCRVIRRHCFSFTFRDNTMMLFGDAKKVVDQILKNI